MDNIFLKNRRVAITGILENLTREQAILKLKEIGAQPVDTVHKKTDLLVVGNRPGWKKEQAQNLGIPTIKEDEFLTLLGTKKTLRIPGLDH
jgi:DNA ligase (NAD+)